jgi:hypothetical protein
MNTDYIFKLFTDSIEHKSDDQIEKEIMQSAHYNAKMFMKYITNLKNFQLKLLAIAQSNGKKDLSADRRKAESLGYHKAFHHVSNINIYNGEHVRDLDLINPFDFSYCLQVTKAYFFEHEAYEKVAFLIEFSDFVEKRYENLNVEP